MVKLIERFSVPTKLDFAEYGTRCKAITEHGNDIYVQTSKDEERPQWIALGHFFQCSLGEFVVNKKFMDECLHLFETNQRAPLNRILDVMANKP